MNELSRLRGSKRYEACIDEAYQGTDNAVFVAAGGSVGTGIGCCMRSYLLSE